MDSEKTISQFSPTDTNESAVSKHEHLHYHTTPLPCLSRLLYQHFIIPSHIQLQNNGLALFQMQLGCQVTRQNIRAQKLVSFASDGTPAILLPPTKYQSRTIFIVMWYSHNYKLLLPVHQDFGKIEIGGKMLPKSRSRFSERKGKKSQSRRAQSKAQSWIESRNPVRVQIYALWF